MDLNKVIPELRIFLLLMKDKYILAKIENLVKSWTFNLYNICNVPYMYHILNGQLLSCHIFYMSIVLMIG